MSKKKKPKFYTVWVGKQTGVFDSWSRCEKNVKGIDGAKYKSFETKEMAEKALREGWGYYWGKGAEKKMTVVALPSDELPKEIVRESICVDAACSGNPGKMEYRGVDLKANVEVFRQGPYVYGTNNIGEFLAIVHALALYQNYEKAIPIYSDSKIAISWIKQKKCKTKLERNAETEPLFKLIDRAENWLKNNTYKNPILKWETKIWGEIPADFGRK